MKEHWLVVSTHLKNMLVKLDYFPKFRGENKKKLKPPSRAPSEKKSQGANAPKNHLGEKVLISKKLAFLADFFFWGGGTADFNMLFSSLE